MHFFCLSANQHILNLLNDEFLAVVNNRQSFSAAQALSVTLARFEFFVRRDLFL